MEKLAATAPAALTPEEYRAKQKRDRILRECGGFTANTHRGSALSVIRAANGAPASATNCRPSRPASSSTTNAAAAGAAKAASTTAADDKFGIPDNEAIDAAYQEFLCNCRALSLKANTALTQRAAQIRYGTTVDVTDNYIGAVGLQAMTPPLAANPRLTKLCVSSNGINNDSVVYLCRALKGRSDGTGALTSLTTLDLSGNPDISLAGGLALLSLIQHQSSVLVELDLSGTQIPAPLQAKMAKALAAKAAFLQTKSVANNTCAPATAARGATVEPLRCGNDDALPAPCTAARGHWHARWAASDAEQVAAFRTRLLTELERQATLSLHAGRTGATTTTRAGPDDGDKSTEKPEEQALPLVPVPVEVHTGWRVIEVPILAAAGQFDSELEAIVTGIFPRLNAELRPRRVVLVPLVHDGRGGTAASHPLSAPGKREEGSASRLLAPHLRHMHFTVGCDILADVRRSRFLTIELIGDQPGSYEQPPSAAMSVRPVVVASDDAQSSAYEMSGQVKQAPPLHPVMHAAHAAAIANSRWLLIATRVSTRRIHGLPAALAPLLSAEPDIEHPDKHRALVKKVGATAATFSGGYASVGSADAAGGKVDRARAIADRVLLTPAVEREQWEKHEAFRAEAIATAPTPELVVTDYPAAFSEVDSRGRVRLSDLDCFCDAIYARLHALATYLFPVQDSQDAGEGELVDASGGALTSVQRAQTCVDINAIVRAVSANPAARALVKKAISNRLNVYVTTPPSRNSLVLHGPDRDTLTVALGVTSSRLTDLPHVYRVATHSCHSSLLHCEEPTDMRAIMLSLIGQLTPNPVVLEYVRSEVDVQRLQRFFVNFLAGVAKPHAASAAADPSSSAYALALKASTGAGANDANNFPTYWDEVPPISAATLADMETVAGTTAATTNNGDREKPAGGKSNSNVIYVVLLDGVDAVAAPVVPCAALRRATPSGADDWAQLTQNDSGFPSKRAAGAALAASVHRDGKEVAVADFLPRSLARNVRLVVSCRTQSEGLLEHLSQRGRDSAEVVGVGASTASDVEQLLSPAALAPQGVELPYEDFMVARGKADVKEPEYCRYLIHCLQLHREEPGFVTQRELLQRLPETTNGMAQLVHDRLLAAFPPALVHRALGLLRAARWGLPLPVLRGLLRHMAPQELQRFLRLLRPVLEHPRGDFLDAEDGNALSECIRLVAPSFLTLLDHLDLSALDPNGPVEDSRSWHRTLAHYYLDLVHRARNCTRDSDDGGSPKQHAGTAAGLSEAEAIAPALHRFAVKELTYHLAEGCLWTHLDKTVLSLPFLALVYRFQLGYHFLRDLTLAFNTRHELLLLGEDVGSLPASAASPLRDPEEHKQSLPLALLRHRDYVFFARAHGRKLMLYPSLVTQVALERPATVGGASVSADAQEHVLKQQFARQQREQQVGRTLTVERTLFSIANTGQKLPIHHGAITAVCPVNNRVGKPFFVTAATDRTLCWLDATAGGAVTYHARQPTARIEREITTRTSAYVGVLAEDRTIYICDANNAGLVSRNDGAEFRAPIADFVFSASGRYYFVATKDTFLRAYDSERGFEHFTLKPSDLCEADAQERGASRAIRVVPHPLDDELFLTIVDGDVRLWSIGGTNEDAVSPLARRACLRKSMEVAARQGEKQRLVDAEWLPIDLTTGAPVRREELGAEAVTLSSWASASGEAASEQEDGALLGCPYVFLHTTSDAPGEGKPNCGEATSVPQADVLMLFDVNVGAPCVERFAFPDVTSVGPGKNAEVGDTAFGQPAVQHCVLTPDGAWLAVAFDDGRIAMYTTLDVGGRPAGSTVSPLCVLNGFASSPCSEPAEPSILGVAFHYDTAGRGGEAADETNLQRRAPMPSLFAIGNEREVKFWSRASLRVSIAAGSDRAVAPVVREDGFFLLDTPASAFASSRFSPLANRPLSTASENGHSDGNGPATAAAEQPSLLKRAVMPAELMVGDEHGRVVLLNFWVPREV